MPRGRGEGGKPFACPLVLVAILADGIFLFTLIFCARLAFGGLCKKSAYCNRLGDLYFQNKVMRMKVFKPFTRNLPACGNRQDTKRNATAKRSEADAWSDWPDCACIKKRALLLCAATCELTSKCKQSAKEWS